MTMDMLSGFEVHGVQFNREGAQVDPSQAQALLARAAARPGPVLVLSHGWNNDMAEARALYTRWLAALRERAAAQAPATALPELVMAVFWPSKKFADEELIPGGAASTDGPDGLLQQQIDALITAFAPAADGTPAEEAQVLAHLRGLVPLLDRDEAAAEDFVRLLRSLMPADVNSEEPVLGDTFYASDGSELLTRLGRPFRPRALASGGATGGAGGAWAGAIDPQSAGGAVFLGNVFSGIKNGARNLLNLFTYYTMKERAGTVGAGQAGQGAAASAGSQADGGVRAVLVGLQHHGCTLHLCGHSFGCRLLSAALALPGGSTPLPAPVGSLLLLQAAFSHWGFAQAYEPGRDGLFRTAFSQGQVRGPTLVSHTPRDRAVGLAYPLASRLRNQVASGIGDENDPYGGMGRNGALRTPEVNPAEQRLRPLDQAYTGLLPGKIHNLESSDFITGHSDVAGPQVAHAWLAALRASA